MEGHVIYSKLTAEEIKVALEKAYPEKAVKIFNSRVEKMVVKNIAQDEVIIALMQYESQLCQAQAQLKQKEQELRDAEESAKKAILSIQTLHKQQQALFDEFVLLRQRYDEQKASTVSILWNQCARFHPDLRQIPPMEDAATYVENDEIIGNLIVGDQLGEGQFATVKSCSMRGSDREYALKIIKKERITSFTSLMRVSNEIDNLRLLKSPYVVSVTQVIHTQTMLYIVTEKGGRDLFEFFDEHPDGVPENWAKEIISCVLKGVLYCHDQGICHRDLKPENILLSFDALAERCIDLKLCDFGLSTKFKVKTLLSDFCGSPGFFAPEMIIHGSYYGDKADVWSIGCILLELVLGHEKFCDVWMTAYDYEVLQDKEVFTGTINETVQHLPSHLSFSNDLNSFILQFLQMKPSQRPTVRQLASHPWLDGMLEEDLVRQKSGRIVNDNRERPYSPLSPNGSFTLDESMIKEGLVAPDVIREAYANLSEKERRQMEEYIMHHKNDQNSIHLPPITPATPSIGHAKKILRNGNELASASRNFSADNHLVNNLSQDFSSPIAGPKGTNKSPLPTLSEDTHGASDIHADSITQPTTPQDTRPRLMESQSTNDIPKLHY